MDEYISREAAVRYLKGFSEKELNWNAQFGTITSSVLDKAERAISEMPAADVQPVRYGRWKLRCYSDYPYCSNCKNEPKSKEITLFCPNCGARMFDDKDNNVRNLTDEETAIYESRIENEAKDTGLNIMDGDAK